MFRANDAVDPGNRLVVGELALETRQRRLGWCSADQQGSESASVCPRSIVRRLPPCRMTMTSCADGRHTISEPALPVAAGSSGELEIVSLPDRGFHCLAPWFDVKCGITSAMNSSSERIATSCGKANDAP